MPVCIAVPLGGRRQGPGKGEREKKGEARHDQCAGHSGRALTFFSFFPSLLSLFSLQHSSSSAMLSRTATPLPPLRRRPPFSRPRRPAKRKAKAVVEMTGDDRAGGRGAPHRPSSAPSYPPLLPPRRPLLPALCPPAARILHPSTASALANNSGPTNAPHLSLVRPARDISGSLRPLPQQNPGCVSTRRRRRTTQPACSRPVTAALRTPKEERRSGEERHVNACMHRCVPRAPIVPRHSLFGFGQQRATVATDCC